MNLQMETLATLFNVRLKKEDLLECYEICFKSKPLSYPDIIILLF